MRRLFGPPIPGSPWFGSTVAGGRGAPPAGVGVRPLLIERAPEVEDKRLRRHTEKTSALLNALLRTGQIVQSAPNTFTIDASVIGDFETDGTAAALMAIHEAATNPHPAYLTQAEGDAIYQPLDATLTALAAFSTSGLLTRTGADTFTGRTITGTADKITVSDGDGVAGNPTLTIAATYVGQNTITTLGTIATGVWQGTAIADSYISSAATWNSKQAGDATLTALAAYNTNGLLTQTAADTFAGRTVTGTTDVITVTNGDGVSGNPTITIAATYVGQTSITTLGTITTGTWTGTTIAVANGGTGATSASDARTNLGLVIGTNVQAYDAELAAIAGLTSAADRLPYFTGSGTASLATFTSAARNLLDDADASTMRTTLGLAIGSDVQAYHADIQYLVDYFTFAFSGQPAFFVFPEDTDNGTNFVRLQAPSSLTGNRTVTLPDVTGTIFVTGTGISLPVANGGTGATGASGARTNLGLEIGTDVQAYSATLAAIVAGTWTGATSITTLGTITTGTWTGTTIAVANGGTGATTDSGARTNLGLAIGTNVQAYDATLAALAAYNTNGILTQTAADTFAGRTITGTADKITVSDGNGVSGNPTITIASTYAGQNTITTLGTIATGVWQGTAIADSYISSAATWNAKQAGDATLTALAAYNTNGLLTQTASDTFAGRTITGTADKITVTNGDGVSGDPTLTIAASYVGQNTITTLGTITTGTWTATAIAETRGGTNQTTYTTGDTLYASASNTLSKLGIGSASTILRVASGIPSWSAQQAHSSACKAWIQWDASSATPTATASYNVASITDHAVGDCSINFTTAFSSANYGIVLGCAQTSGNVNARIMCISETNVPTASACRLLSGVMGQATNWTLQDRVGNHAAFFGDQ